MTRACENILYFKEKVVDCIELNASCTVHALFDASVLVKTPIW